MKLETEKGVFFSQNGLTLNKNMMKTKFAWQNYYGVICYSKLEPGFLLFHSIKVTL